VKIAFFIALVSFAKVCPPVFGRWRKRIAGLIQNGFYLDIENGGQKTTGKTGFAELFRCGLG
jgi:hypothetical protein